MTDLHNLSGREIEILQLVAKGLTNREIAQKLVISPNTVKVHLSNIFEKISVASRTEATMYGIEHGLVDVPGVSDVQPEPPESVPLGNWRKYIGVIVPVSLLLVAFLVFFVIKMLNPEPVPDTQVLTELNQRWQELSPLPVARAGMAAAAYNGEIYAIAGEGPKGISGSVFRYTPETDRWTQLSEKPLPVADVHGVLIGEKIYVPGGRRPDGTPTDILEIYDPRRDSWSEGAQLPQAVSAYALADFEGQMYLFGGWDGEKTLKDVFVYDPGADEWRVGTPMALSRRDHGAVAMMDKIVVLGGRNDEGVLADAVSYYPSRDVGAENPWEDFEDLPEPRYGFGVEGVSDSIYVMGGETVENSACMLSGLVFNGKAWDTFASEIEEHCQPWHLVPIGSLLYFINHQGQDHPGQLWSYRAFYYEIYIPIVK